ncbi:MAG: DUF3854 domain-containing protein, partial [Armatimonadetes bacterium]|nr:DUF3854 domain-containing protein [Armatimonadota bacterium]
MPLLITEGVKKADAAISQGACCLAVLGVWNWRGTNEHGGKTTLPDFDEIAWKGETARDVYLCFDSDCMTKPPVHLALERLGEVIRKRGARLRFVYLPHQPDGSKMGLDDYLALGKTPKDIFALAVEHLKPLPSPESVPLPYELTSTGIVWNKATKDGTIPQLLTNFGARIAADVLCDDGVERQRSFHLECTLKGAIHSFQVKAEEFDACGWASRHLGAAAVIFPGRATNDHLRVAIRQLSPDVPVRRVYAHTGWIQDEDRWLYLHNEGALGHVEASSAIEGASSITTQLPEGLESFVLPVPNSETANASAVRASLELLNLFPVAIAVPLLASVYRSALRPVDLGMWFAGPSGTFKSEVAAIGQAHFGAGWTSRNLPCSWASTPTFIEAMGFHLKDALCVIDDFAPRGSLTEISQLHARADRILRNQGNGSGRGRGRVDGTPRRAKPPRGLFLSTGEDLPDGYSLRARLLVVNFEPGLIDSKNLTIAQNRASDGHYARSMAAFISHQAGHYNYWRENLGSEVRRLSREFAQSGLSDGHLRLADNIANLFLGYESFVLFAAAAGVVGEEERESLMAQGRRVLLALAHLQKVLHGAKEPAQRFLELLRSALIAGRAHIADLRGEAPDAPSRWGWRHSGSGNYTEWQGQGERIGWVDDEQVYLNTDAALGAANKMSFGEGISLSGSTLHRRLAERGYLASRDSTRQTLTIRKVINGVRQEVLHLRAATLMPAMSEDA